MSWYMYMYIRSDQMVLCPESLQVPGSQCVDMLTSSVWNSSDSERGLLQALQREGGGREGGREEGEGGREEGGGEEEREGGKE